MQAITHVKAVDKVTIDNMNLSQGKRTRLYRLLYQHGPANGTLMPLPVDQGLEHGPRDFFDNPESIHPEVRDQGGPRRRILGNRFSNRDCRAVHVQVCRQASTDIEV